MTCIRSFLALALFAAFTSIAGAQVTVKLEVPKRSYLAGEPVIINVLITNMSGRDLKFQGSSKMPWIDFIVNSNRGVPLTAVARPAFGSVLIPAGKSMSRTVDLSKLYAFRDLGNYSIYAIARLPDQKTEGYLSQRHLFTISTAKPYWSQVVGVPGRNGRSNEFRLIQFTGGRKTELFAQIADAQSGLIQRTHALGEVLMFRKPSVIVDTSLTMHVLYLITPSIWGHARIAPDGSFLGRDLYKSSDLGDPKLMSLGDGSVRALGGIPYDPKAEAEERARSRKASDRPNFIYE